VAQLPEVLLRVLLKAQLLLQLLLLEGWGTWRGLPGQLSHNWPKIKKQGKIYSNTGAQLM
jgi:hypothetical protein